MTEPLSISAKDAYKIIACLIATHRKSNPAKEIPVEWVSGLCGIVGSEYCEVRGGGYSLSFIHKGGMLTGCQSAKTPSGKEWCARTDDGDPFSQLSIEDRKYLTAMMLDVKKEEFFCEVIPAWIVRTDKSFPYAAHLFRTKEEAEVARLEQIEFYHKNRRSKGEKKEEAALAKEEIKAINSIANKPKKFTRAPKG